MEDPFSLPLLICFVSYIAYINTLIKNLNWSRYFRIISYHNLGNSIINHNPSLSFKMSFINPNELTEFNFSRSDWHLAGILAFTRRALLSPQRYLGTVACASFFLLSALFSNNSQVLFLDHVWVLVSAQMFRDLLIFYN